MSVNDKKVRGYLQEIRTISKALPAKDYRKVSNRCDKISVELRRAGK